jgi:hypothetical protein
VPQQSPQPRLQDSGERGELIRVPRCLAASCAFPRARRGTLGERLARRQGRPAMGVPTATFQAAVRKRQGRAAGPGCVEYAGGCAVPADPWPLRCRRCWHRPRVRGGGGGKGPRPWPPANAGDERSKARALMAPAERGSSNRRPLELLVFSHLGAVSGPPAPGQPGWTGGWEPGRRRAPGLSSGTPWRYQWRTSCQSGRAARREGIMLAPAAPGPPWRRPRGALSSSADACSSTSPSATEVGDLFN